MEDTKIQVCINNVLDFSKINERELECLATDFEELIIEFYKSKQKEKEPP